ncbi:hypothetical protein CEXT_757801 [Caerostris extrusa]|uniref:Uncharacterized protein n=1 Tax=Caerostris extrusa TaxID=172846 RepID=A0AAV4P9C0_CAEEX|nr:hypothetical protein CEXT_757801 [Caerostris extrusa]
MVGIKKNNKCCKGFHEAAEEPSAMSTQMSDGEREKAAKGVGEHVSFAIPDPACRLREGGGPSKGWAVDEGIQVCLIDSESGGYKTT